MDELELSDVLALMLATGGLESQLARVRWPMHLALREAHDAAGRRGELAALGADLKFRPSPELGQEALGADGALRALVRRGVLTPEGKLGAASFVLDRHAAVALRRRLMTLPPAQAAVLQRAGA